MLIHSDLGETAARHQRQGLLHGEEDALHIEIEELVSRKYASVHGAAGAVTEERALGPPGSGNHSPLHTALSLAQRPFPRRSASSAPETQPAPALFLNCPRPLQYLIDRSER